MEELHKHGLSERSQQFSSPSDSFRCPHSPAMSWLELRGMGSRGAAAAQPWEQVALVLAGDAVPKHGRAGLSPRVARRAHDVAHLRRGAKKLSLPQCVVDIIAAFAAMSSSDIELQIPSVKETSLQAPFVVSLYQVQRESATISLMLFMLNS